MSSVVVQHSISLRCKDVRHELTKDDNYNLLKGIEMSESGARGSVNHEVEVACPSWFRSKMAVKVHIS